MRREIGEAVRACCYCCSTEVQRERLAAAVIRAALTGEPEGEYRAVRSGDDWHVVREMLSARERSAGGYPLNPLYMGKREADARAVAHALNLSRALAVGGET